MGRWMKDEKSDFVYSPYRLKFYEEEHKIFSEAYDKKLDEDGIYKIFKKLRRHYKLYLSINYNDTYTGHFRINNVEMPKKASFGLLCHEIAHAIDYKRRRITKHDKKMLRVMIRVTNYCKKKNYWEK